MDSEVYIALWLIMALFTWGYFIGDATKGELKWWSWIAIPSACIFLWPLILGASISEKN